jgi:hypothetical protein
MEGNMSRPKTRPQQAQRHRPRTPALAFAITLLAVAGSRDANATVLTFDQIRVSGTVVPTISGNAVPQDYGDRVSAGTMAVPGGQFTYGNLGEGFTPNIEVGYVTGTGTAIAPGVSLWEASYGDLVNVAFGNQNSGMLSVRLSADAGFEALLYGFDLGGWPNADYTIDAVRVRAQGLEIFTQPDVTVEGNLVGARRTSFAFATPLAGNDLLIEIDYGNLAGAQQDNIGIDNIRFGQTPPASLPPDPPSDPVGVPAPASLALLGIGLAAIAAFRRPTPHPR